MHTHSTKAERRRFSSLLSSICLCFLDCISSSPLPIACSFIFFGSPCLQHSGLKSAVGFDTVLNAAKRCEPLLTLEPLAHSPPHPPLVNPSPRHFSRCGRIEIHERLNRRMRRLPCWAVPGCASAGRCYRRFGGGWWVVEVHDDLQCEVGFLQEEGIYASVKVCARVQAFRLQKLRS